jgi:Tol biopolymer transport system component
MKKLFLLLISLTLIIGFQGCNKSPTGSEGEDTDEIKLSENTVILADSTVNKIDQESGDSIIYFDKDAQEILQLEDGDVIVSSVGEGFLRKVKETKEEGSYIVVRTEYAALEDAIEKGNLAISNKTLNFDGMRTTSKLRGVRFKPRGDLLEVDFNSLIYDDPATGAEIRGVGKSVFGAVIDTVGAEFLFGLQSFKFGLKVYHSESLGVEITKGCSFEGKIKLASFALTPILVHVGIPIVITPHVDLYIGANLNVQASVSTSVQKDDTIIGGITYSKAQGWATFSDYKKSFSYSPPSVSLSGEAEIYAVVPEISLQIYELAGPYAQMEGYGRIEVDPQVTPWWTLYGGFEVEGGVKMEILAWNVTWSGSIYSKEWELASAGGGANTPPNTPSTPSGQNEGTINTEYTFTTSTTDPDGDNVAYQFDWGDGNTSSWSGYVSSGSSISMSHSYSSVGTYNVKAQAKDINGAESGWSSGHQIDISEEVTGKITFDSDRDGNYEIYVMNADGTNQVRLTNNSAMDCYPSWSPDGSMIAFTSDRDGNYEIYVMNADGTNQVRLTNNSTMDRYPFWSPDGTKIGFNREDDTLYIMNSNGTNQIALIKGVRSRGCWSPDGTKIAVTLYDTLIASNQYIYIINADGTDSTKLTDMATLNFDKEWYPSWSPDGMKITFSGLYNRSTWYIYDLEIYTVNVDGTNLTRLTSNSDEDSYPCFSPDGGLKIAFTSSAYLGNHEIYVMNADGSDIHNISNNSANDEGPDWK